MKFKNYDYYIVKAFNRKMGIIFYSLKALDDEVLCRAIVDDGKVGLIDFEIKKKFIKGWVIDEDYCPYEYLMDICRENSEKVRDAIKEADKVADDLKIFRNYLEERKEIKINECHHMGPPENKEEK